MYEINAFDMRNYTCLVRIYYFGKHKETHTHSKATSNRLSVVSSVDKQSPWHLSLSYRMSYSHLTVLFINFAALQPVNNILYFFCSVDGIVRPLTRRRESVRSHTFSVTSFHMVFSVLLLFFSVLFHFVR